MRGIYETGRDDGIPAGWIGLRERLADESNPWIWAATRSMPLNRRRILKSNLRAACGCAARFGWRATRRESSYSASRAQR